MPRLDGSPVLGALVSSGSTTVRKRLSAVPAAIGLLAGVRPFVRHNVALVGEAPRADGASKGLLAGVRPSVSLDVAGCCSTVSTPAPMAGKRLLARVCSSVILNLVCV